MTWFLDFNYDYFMVLFELVVGDWLHIGDVTIPTQVIEYNHFFLQVDQPIRLQYSPQIKLL